MIEAGSRDATEPQLLGVHGRVGFSGVSLRNRTGSPRISPEGLVLAYDMHTFTSRGDLKDFSGTGNDGCVVGTETAQGPFGPAIAFRSTSDYVRLPFRRSLHIRGPISIAVWVRLARLGVHQHIVAYDDLYSLWIDDRDRIRFSDTRGNAFESRPGLVPVGEWTSLVTSFAGRRGTSITAENISLHVNGERAGGRAFGSWNPGRPVEGYVGKESHEGQFHLPLYGEVAAVLVFRRALHPAEVEAFADVAPGSVDRNTPVGAADPLAASADASAVLVSAAGGVPSPTRHTVPRVRAPSGLASEVPASTVRANAREFTESGFATYSSGDATVRVCPRVVRITNIVPPYRVPTLELLQDSPSFVFEQWVMALSERNRGWDSSRLSSRVRTFRDWGLDLSHRDMFTAHFNPGMLLELSRRPPDLVILGGYEQPTCLYSGLALARIGVPFLLSSESISLRDSFVGRNTPFLVRKLVQKSEGFIVPGRAARDHLLELGAPEDRIFVAPNAVDVERFVPPRSVDEKRAARLGLGLPDKTLCLSVARLAPTKGIADLLTAFGSLRPGERNLHLLLGGQGRLRPMIDARISRDPSLRGNVSVLGYIPEDLLPAYFLASDMFVFPTHRDIWGLVLNEAMGAGLAVISSDGAAGAADLIEDGESGLIVPRGQPTELAAAIERLQGDPGLRQRLGACARERILAGFTPRHRAMAFHRAILTTLERLGRSDVDVRRIEALG